LCSKKANIEINEALGALERKKANGDQGSKQCPAEEDCFKFCISAKYLSPGVMCIFGSWITFYTQNQCAKSEELQRTEYGLFTEVCVYGPVSSDQGY
jgi:hypothetical protein